MGRLFAVVLISVFFRISEEDFCIPEEKLKTFVFDFWGHLACDCPAMSVGILSVVSIYCRPPYFCVIYIESYAKDKWLYHKNKEF